jgi:PAS domain S-box-containing protein
METKDKTINKRQSLLLAGILAIFIAAGGYLYYRHQANTIREQKHTELQAISELKINQLVQWRKERIGDGRVFSTLPYLVREVDQWLQNKTNFKLKEDIKKLLTIPQKEYSYQDVFLSSTNGELLLSVGGKLVDFDSAVSENIKKAALVDSLVSSDFYYCKTENTIHYDIIAPLKNEKNLTIAMLVLRINPYDYLYPFIQSWPTPSISSETLIIRKDGDSVLFLNDLRFHTGSALSLKVPLTRKEAPAVQSVLGLEGIFEGKDYRDVDVLAFNHHVTGTSWYMVAKVDQSEIYSDLYEQAIFIFVFSGILMLLCAVGIMWIYHYRQRNIYRTLWQTQEEYRTTLLSIGDAVIATDKEGRVRHLNYVAEQLTGWKENDAKNKMLEEVFHVINEDTRIRIENPVQMVLKEGHVVGLVNHTLLISKNGKEIPIADSGAPIRDDKNEIIGVVLVFRDQTQERANQRALQESARKLSEVQKMAQLGNWIWDVRTGSVEWSDEVFKIFRLDPKEFIPHIDSILELSPWPEDHERDKELIRKAMESHEVGQYEQRFLRPDKSIGCYFSTFQGKYDDKDNLIGIVGTVQDITERKRAEEEILKLNRTYAVLSTINELIVRENNREKLLNEVCKIAVQDGKFRMSWIGMLDEKTGRVNPVAGAGVMDGYLENLHITISDTLLGRGPTGIALREGSVVICDDIEHDDCMIPWRERALALGYCSSASLPLIINDKAIGVINFYSTELNYFHEEEVRLLEELAMDVSYALKSLDGEDQRRQTEEKLEYERHLITVLMESIPDHIYFKDKESRFIRVNKSQAQIFGFRDPKEVIGKTDFDFFLKEHAQKAFQDEQTIVLTGKSIIDVEEKETWPDGSITWVSTTKVPLRSRQGQIIGTFGISRDITERKLLQKQIQDAFDFNQIIIDLCPIGIWIYEESGKTININEAGIKMAGGDAEKLLSLNFRELESWKKSGMFDTAMQALESQKLVRREIHAVNVLNEEVWYEALIMPFRLKDTKHLLLMTYDIKDRMRTEEALRQSEKKLNNAMTIAMLGAWEYDVVSDRFTFNDQFYSLLHTTVEKEGGYTMSSAHYSQKFVHADDRSLIGMEIQKALETVDTDYHTQLDHRIIYSDGKEGYFTVSIYIEKDANGRTVRTYGVNQDITERKRIEEALIASEKEFRLLTEAMPQIVWITRADGWNIYFNQQWVDYTGLTLEESYGHGWSIPFHPDDQRRAWDAWQYAVTNNGTYSIECRLRRKDGIYHWWLIRGIPISNESGKILKWFGTCTDIDELKRTEEELMKNEALMRTAVENLPLIFYVIDRDGKFKLSIGAGLKGLDLNPNQVVDQSVYDVYKEYPEIIVSVEKSLAGESVTFESNVAGNTFVNYLTPLAILKGTSEGIVGVAMDVTEQKILQKELLQSQKMESVGTLAGGIAHDFNNILGIILAYSSMLERTAGDKNKISEYSGVIGQAVNRGAGLVRQILTFARKTDVALAPMSFIDLIHELISMLKQTFPKVIMFTEVIESEIPVVNADRSQIHQVLLNLCVNARDAMPSGGSITFKVDILAKLHVQERFPAADQDSYIVVSVIDTGTGMNEETRRRIFDPFYTTKEQGKGTGLGLAVVYGVVQSHHGFIDVESELGRGTTFRLYFPISSTDEQAGDIPLITESFSIGGTETILVVEDEEALIEMVRLLLESKGYKVLTAQDGKEAVELYRQHKQEIDIVLTDMGLPGMTGADEFKMLKEIAPNVKVIFASGFFEPVIKSDLYIAGAKGFIQKPYSPDEILRQIREVLDAKG